MSDFVHKLKVFLGVAEDFDEEEVVEVPRRQQDEDVVPFRRERTKNREGSPFVEQACVGRIVWRSNGAEYNVDNGTARI